MNPAAALVALSLAALLALSGCGGGGGSEGGPPVEPGADQPLDDATAYSSQPNGSLPGASEASAKTHHRITLNGTAIDYRAEAGHLIARHPGSGAAQASLFHVSYIATGAAASATRPVTFFYNGGPGSASVWLHLGSFGPKRLVTGVPATTMARPFPLVDNADCLLDVSDLVFLDAVGTGRSTAIAPFRNLDFWGVDADAQLFRDAVRRWLEMHGRSGAPFFLYGESYGGPRTALLARRLQEIGLAPAGLMLQSPALDYHSNCGVSGEASVACDGYLPSFAAAGSFFGLTWPPLPSELLDFLDFVAEFVFEIFKLALEAFLELDLPAPDLWGPLSDYTGLPAAQWQSNLNVGPERFRRQLIPGQLVGRYDARIAAPTGSALAAEGDPSSTLIGASFASAIDAHLRDTLRYRNGSTYVLLSRAIASWDFSHAGRSLPDTVPDLQAALGADTRLRVIAMSGVHDLATPYLVTETDLARLSDRSRVSVRRYAGGHMSFLDDATRPRQKADLVDFYRRTLAGRPALEKPLRVLPAAAPDRAGDPLAAAGQPKREPALQVPMLDPWVPARVRPGPGPR